MSLLIENVEQWAVIEQLVPSSTSFDPIAVVAHDVLPRFHQDLHLRCRGTLPPINIYEFRNCTIGPNGEIITPSKDVIGAPDVLGSKWTRDRLTEALQSRDDKNLLIRAVAGNVDVMDHDGVDPVFVLNRPGSFVYGHWLLDILPMLFILFYAKSFKEDCATLDNVELAKLRFLLPKGTPRWATEFLSMLFGVEADRIIYYPQHTSVFRAARLLVTSQMRFGDFCSLEMNRYVEFIKSAVLPLATDHALPDKIFVTRKDVNSAMPRGVHNEDVLIGLAKRLGIVEIDPARLSWPDQVRLFLQAKFVCGPFGSGLHNTMFGDESLICLSLGSSRMNWIQSGLSALRQQRMGYLLPIYEDFRDGKNVMIYDTERFCHAINVSLKAAA